MESLTTPVYRPKYKAQSICCGSGTVVLCTGWTASEQLTKFLDKNEYAAVGELYSATRGINLLVRNLLLNPHVTHLVLLSGTAADRVAGSIQCLADFFYTGIRAGTSDLGKPCWKINSDISGYIDSDIPFADLSKLRMSIKLHLVRSKQQAIALVKEINANRNDFKLNQLAVAKEYPFPEFTTSSTLPGQQYGQVVRGETIAEAWVKLLQRVVSTGRMRFYANETVLQELIDTVTIVESEPEELFFPTPNYLPTTPEYIEAYLSSAIYDSGRQSVSYTYGQRLRSLFGHDQVKSAIAKLIANIDSSQCAINLWDSCHDHNSSTPPCLNHIWLRVSDNKLSMTATFRSHDVYGAWVQNVMALRKLQAEVQKEVNKVYHSLIAGPLIIVSQSAHIYDHSIAAAQNVANEYYSKYSSCDYDDPVGNFLIE
jgi:thymidylate synthase